MNRRRVLIETSWNVKNKNHFQLNYTTGINRNIVECKVCFYCWAAKPCYCINRNIVECKDEMKVNRKSWRRVLIETSWNVKECCRGHEPIRSFRINRNIVECKVEYILFHFEYFVVLIETSWNVKPPNYLRFNISFSGINRNIVECKGRSRRQHNRRHGVLIETSWNVKFRPDCMPAECTQY